MADKGAMKTTSNFFADFDMFAASPTLRANEEPILSSFCTGIFSFLLTGLFFYIFVNKMVDVGNYKEIESVQTEGLLKASEANAEELLFALGIDVLSYDEIYQYFAVDLTVEQNGSSTIFNLKQCSPDQWTILGQQYQDLYDESGLANFLCPVSREGLNINRTRLKKPKKVKIEVYPCIFGQTPQCLPLVDHDLKMANLMNQYGFLEFYLYILDQNLAPQARNPITHVLNIDNSFTFHPKQGVFVSAYFGKYNVQTDVNLAPWPNKIEIGGTYLRQVKTGNFERRLNTNENYARIEFEMDSQFTKLTRKVGKIDNALSYAGGLFAIIVSVLAFFLMSYNEYRYQLMIAERMFNFDTDGNKIKQSDMHFINYLIYSILDWVDALCCVELQWPYFQKIHRTRDEVNKQLDVSQLFRKIQNVEVSLLHVISQKQKDCLALTETQTIDQLKRERLISEYYQALIKGKAALTLEDIKNMRQISNYANKLAKNQNKNKLVEDLDGTVNELIDNESSPEKQNFDLMYKKACRMYPELVKEAQEAQLEEELLQTEKILRQSFSGLNENMKKSICWRIPLKILFRLKMQITNDGQTENKILAK